MKILKADFTKLELDKEKEKNKELENKKRKLDGAVKLGHMFSTHINL